MRYALCVVMLAVCLFAFHCTADEGETGDSHTPSVVTPPVPLSPPSLPNPGANPASQSNPGSGGDLIDNNGKDLSDGSSAAKPETTTTNTDLANVATEDKTKKEDKPSAPQQGGQQPEVHSDPLTITQDAGRSRQTQSQPQLPHTDTDQKETEGNVLLTPTVKTPKTPHVSPPVLQTTTTTITQTPLASTGVTDPAKPQQLVSTDNTLTSGGAQRQQPDRLGQPLENTATTTGIQTGTQLAQQITPQDPKNNPAGTKPVSAQAPQPIPITGDNALAKATDQQLSTPATPHQLTNPVTGKTPSTNAAAAADPVKTKATTSTKSPTRHGHNPATTDSGIKNKIHALALKSTTSTAAPEDSPQTSLTSTTESTKNEFTAPANPSPELSKTLQHVDLKDGSIGSSLLAALTALVTLTVMAVAPVS